MTFVRRPDLYCNGCGQTVTQGFDWPDDEPEPGARAVRAFARREGWRSVKRDGRAYDFCAACVAAEKHR